MANLLSMPLGKSFLRQTREQLTNPRTILWKITGKNCRQPSYLLGTFHLAEAEWLYSYTEIKTVIDSTDFILTEAFSTDSVVTISTATKNEIKALPLLTSKQFNVLDSFFVARVGEGIKGNEDAANMTLAEMRSAIVTTLISQTKGPNGITSLMDLDLFNLYQKRGRKGDRLDRVAPSEFDSASIDHARQHLARSLSYIDGSDKPDWNIYKQTGIEELRERYKKFDFDYKLSEQADSVSTSPDFDFVPVEVRNRNWMNKITSTIASRPTLIAVGLGHLYYKTGVIALLRQLGYQVEPVILSKP